jgi:hypothetical protein
MRFLFRLILAVGIGAAIFFLVTGSSPSNLPKATEEGFKVEVDDSSTVGEWKEKIKNIFSENSTSTEIESNKEGEDKEADVEFFKNLISKSVEEEEISLEEPENETKEDNFLQKIINNLKNQFNIDDSEKDASEKAFSSKVDSVPSFTTVCFPETKQTCSPSGCKETSPKVEFTLLNKEESVIAHCDSEGCVTYDAEYIESGDYENYQPTKPEGYIISKQVNPEDSSGRSPYIEAVIRGIEITTYSGYCLEREASDN